GQYNITFESLYFKGNTINLEINDSNAGTEIPVNCILNESMIPINIINETGHSLENISISVCGPTAYNGKTDSNGWLNKTVILPGNYTIYFTNIT
ncbi:MAG: hypothetical protein U9P44_02805, partial [archaeon]|nr:hypothetical protein [archaeon]